MPLYIKADISLYIESRKTLEFLERITERLRHFRPAYVKVDPIIRDIVRLNFAAKGRPPWPPLKGKKDYSGILTKSGKLRDAALNAIFTANDQVATWTAAVGAGGVAQQYGVTSTVFVPELIRRVTSVFGKTTSEKLVRVKAHIMHITIPPRVYFAVPLGYGEPQRIGEAVREWIFSGV